jgi:uroporphyrinogen decarboxylase
MPNRERFQAICRGEKPGDVSIMYWHNRPLPETPQAWIEQGAPEDIIKLDSFIQYFQLEPFNSLFEIISGGHRADLKKAGISFHYVTPPIVPVFDIDVLEEDERHRVETTYGGAKVIVNKKYPWRMPRYLDRPVNDWATWNEYKKRLNPETPQRWPSDWNAFVQKTNNEDVPTCLQLFGFFASLREWLGTENLLYMFYDDPKLIEDMMEHLLDLHMGIARRALKDLMISRIDIQEDIAYKTGPLISPDMVKKFIIPRLKKLTDFLHSNGIKIIHIDSDGNIEKLIPIWLEECGINFHWPLEVTAGMDAVALRKKYGKDLILAGNIDKQVFRKGKDAISHEVMSKVPFLLETGGYFPSLDHSIPPDISLEDFRFFINLLREIGGMDKLPE